MRAIAVVLLASAVGFGVPTDSFGQRAVLVVYDDSGSMETSIHGRWKYGNYALQVLAALLETRDTLQIVRMSRPDFVESLELTDRDATLDHIRTQGVPRADTPYAAVRTASEALEKAGADDRWLIVITDGAFEETLDADQLRGEVQAFVRETGARTLYLVIGDHPQRIEELSTGLAIRTWVQEAQADVYGAVSQADIIRRMEQIAAAITARSDEAPTGLQVVDSTVVVDSAFPLTRLTVFQQASRPDGLNHVTAVDVAGDQVEQIDPLSVEMPVGGREVEPVVGRVTHLEQTGDRVIAAGSLRVRFDGIVEGSSLRVFPEVAARMDVRVLKPDGRPVSAEQSLLRPCIGDSITVQATLVSPRGDTLLLQMRRPAHVRMRLRHGGQSLPMTLARSRAYFYGPVVVGDAPFTLSVAASYPGYFNFRSEILSVQGVECPVRTIGLRTSGSWSTEQDRVATAASAIVTPTVEGQALTAAESAGWDLAVADDGDLVLEIERRDGGWALRPRTSWWPFRQPDAGRHAVTVRVTSDDPREAALGATLSFEVRKVSFWRRWGRWLLGVLGLILLLLYLYCIVRKRRFPVGSEVEVLHVTFEDDLDRRSRRHRLPTRWYRRYLIPCVPERQMVGGIVFEASPKGAYVFVPSAQLHEEMYIDGERTVEKDERRPARPKLLYNGSVLEVRRKHRHVQYTYHNGRTPTY